MLNDKQIQEALIAKEIQIFYYFHKDNNGEVSKLGKEKSFLDDDEFLDYLYSDRLKVALGSVIRPLTTKRINKKHRFKSYSDCYDLTKSNNTYVIHPAQTIIILTNERITLDGKHSVLVIPRVSLSEVGIIVTPAYIDPFYNGLLRLNVTNNSKVPYELKVLETIAECFFFELPDSVDEKYEKEFAQKSVFFGQNWKAIFDEDRPPFPTKKNKKDTNVLLDALKYSIHTLFKFINKNSLIATVISTLLLGYVGYKTFNNNNQF